MSGIRVVAFICLCLPLICGMARADDLRVHEFAGLTVGVSTFGPTTGAEIRVSERLGIRTPVSLFSYSDDVMYEGNSIRGRIKSRQAAVMLDYYPGGDGFRMSAGVALGGYEIMGEGEDLRLTDTASGLDYTVQGRYGATVRQRSPVAPMLSVGYGARLSDRVLFSADAGIKVTTYELRIDTTDLEADPLFDDTDIRAFERDFNDEARGYPVTPFVQIGLTLRF